MKIVTGAREYALLVTDPDAAVPSCTGSSSGSPLVHEADRGAPLAGSSEGSSFGGVGYGDRALPEDDDPHPYDFTVYALDVTVSDDLEARTGADEVAAIECCVKVHGTLTGTCGR